MIHFVVVAGRPARTSTVADDLGGALQRTRYFEGDLQQHAAPSGCWRAAVLAVPDPVVPTRVRVEGNDLALLNGPAMATDGDQAHLLKRVLDDARSGSFERVADRLTGGYNLVTISRRRGLRAFGDFAGVYPLYYFVGRGVTIVSNRPSTIRDVLGDRRWNLHALSWLVGHSNLFADEMPARGVQYLPPGRALRADWGRARARLERSPTWIWPEPSDAPLRDNLTPSEWDEITDDLIGSARSLRILEEWPRLLLSGGKDSRLCLALLKAAGLADEVRAVTNGRADSPELACAVAVAAAGGFEHTHVGLPARQSFEPPPFDAERVWHRLGQAVYRYDGIVNPWDGLTNSTKGTVLNIKGFGGELYRRSHAPRFKKGGELTLDEMADEFVDFHQRMDPLGALRPDEASQQVEFLRSWVHDTAKEVRLDLLPEKFYVDYRLGHWNGPLGQYKAAYININPLLHPRAAVKCLELSREARQSERFHYEVMRRAAPELVTVPYLADTWAPAIRADAPEDLPDEPFPTAVEPTTRVLKTWQWRFIETQAAEIEQLVRDAVQGARLGKHCKPQRLVAMARRGPTLTNNVRAKALVAVTAVALTALDRGEPNVDRPLAS